MQWKRLRGVPEFHKAADELGDFAVTKPPRHSWKQVSLLEFSHCEVRILIFFFFCHLMNGDFARFCWNRIMLCCISIMLC